MQHAVAQDNEKQPKLFNVQVNIFLCDHGPYLHDLAVF